MFNYSYICIVLKKIKINSDKIRIGGRIECKRTIVFSLTKGRKYEILNISDDVIDIIDDTEDELFTLCLSLDKDDSPNIFQYFKVW